MYDKNANFNNSRLFINLKTKKPADLGRFNMYKNGTDYSAVLEHLDLFFLQSFLFLLHFSLFSPSLHAGLPSPFWQHPVGFPVAVVPLPTDTVYPVFSAKDFTRAS